MSETAIISQEYQSFSTLFRKLNRYIVLIKKRHFHLPGAGRLDDAEVVEAKRFLDDLLGEIIADLKNVRDAAAHPPATRRVPKVLIKRLQEHQKARMAWYVDDLEELRQALRGNCALNEDLIKCLDDLIGQLDLETNALYRKLMRR